MKLIPDGGISKLITQVEGLDNLPPGPCADCGDTFEGELLDDDHLCVDCEGRAYSERVRAENEAAEDAEDAALYKEGMRIWDKALKEVEAQDAARVEADYARYLAEEDPEEWLLARERAVKDREISRRERRQDARDSDDASEPAAGLTFADFGQPVTLLDVERLPSAFVRDDGETLLYAGVANTIFGEPSSGKSWIGLMAVIQQLRAGRRVIWWDNEDRATTLAKRLQLLRATDLIGVEALAFRTGEMDLSETAMAEALAFLDGGNGPGLVVLDSANRLQLSEGWGRRASMDDGPHQAVDRCGPYLTPHRSRAEATEGPATRRGRQLREAIHHPGWLPFPPMAEHGGGAVNLGNYSEF